MRVAALAGQQTLNPVRCPVHQVIDEAELQRRMEACRRSGEQHFYIMELQPGYYIDARKRGNLARMLNSSCEPNCETQKW